jgi:hypothetical protein
VNEKKLISQLVEALDLDEFTEGYRRRLQILDSQIEAFRKLEQTYRERLTDMDKAITNLVAVCKVCSRLNILCLKNEADASEMRKTKGPQDDSEKDINKKLSDWH